MLFPNTLHERPHVVLSNHERPHVTLLSNHHEYRHIVLSNHERLHVTLLSNHHDALLNMNPTHHHVILLSNHERLHITLPNIRHDRHALPTHGLHLEPEAHTLLASRLGRSHQYL